MNKEPATADDSGVVLCIAAAAAVMRRHVSPMNVKFGVRGPAAAMAIGRHRVVYPGSDGQYYYNHLTASFPGEPG